MCGIQPDLLTRKPVSRCAKTDWKGVIIWNQSFWNPQLILTAPRDDGIVESRSACGLIIVATVYRVSVGEIDGMLMNTATASIER